MTTVVLNTAANVDDSQFPALTGGAAAPVTLQLGVDAPNQRVQLGANALAAGVTEVLYQPTSGATASNGATIDVQDMQAPMLLIGSGSGNHFMLRQGELAETTIDGGSRGGENFIGLGDAVSITDADFSHGNFRDIQSLQLFSGAAGQSIRLGAAAVAEGITGIYTENANGTFVDLSGMAGTPGVTVRSASQSFIVGSPGNDHYRFFMGDLNSTDTIQGHAGSTNAVEIRDEGHIDDDNFAHISNVQVAALTFDHSGQHIQLGALAQAAGVRTVEFTSGGGLPIHGYLADVSQMTVGVTIHGTANNDTMLGGSGNDTFIIGANSSDSIVGGGGTDTAVFVNPKSAYSITISGGVVSVFQNVHSVDTISGVAQLQFADQTVSVASLSTGSPPPSGAPPSSGSNQAQLAVGFDSSFYLAHNPDVAAAGLDAFTHYQLYGWKEGRNPDGFFDITFYLQHNPDVAAAHIDALAHYELYGWKEGRDPSASFSTLGYLAANPDVKLAGMDPLDHYLLYGLAEGRHLS
jgi:hypothetical protein